MTRYTTVTLGRNIGAQPMPDEAWLRFRSRVSDVIGSPTFTFSGVGSWDGIEEESLQMVWLDAPDGAISAARGILPIIAREFSQDAIALSDGESELVTGASL